MNSSLFLNCNGIFKDVKFNGLKFFETIYIFFIYKKKLLCLLITAVLQCIIYIHIK